MPSAIGPVAHPMPPSALISPLAAGPVLMGLVIAGARAVSSASRRGREVRALNRIAVLPSGWDAAGRHCDR